MSKITNDRAKEMAELTKKNFMQPDGPLEQWAWGWLANSITRNKRAEIEVVDCGYDYSTYGRRTNQPFCVSDFNTVRDFLNEPTGNTTATYVSGYGMAAETYKDDFLQDALEQINNWIEKQGYFEGMNDDERFDAWDELTDALIVADVSEDIWLEEFFCEKLFCNVQLIRHIRSLNNGKS